MSPRYVPKPAPGPSWSESQDEAFENEVATEYTAMRGRQEIATARNKVRIALAYRTLYAPGSPHCHVDTPHSAKNAA